MIDREDRHEVKVIVDFVDDPKVAPPSAVLAFQLEPKGAPDPMRVLDQPAIHELDTGGCDLVGETVE